MAWEDGNPESVFALLEAAESTSNKATAKSYLIQALGSAKVIKDSYKRSNLVALIEDKLKELE